MLGYSDVESKTCEILIHRSSCRVVSSNLRDVHDRPLDVDGSFQPCLLRTDASSISLLDYRSGCYRRTANEAVRLKLESVRSISLGFRLLLGKHNPIIMHSVQNYPWAVATWHSSKYSSQCEWNHPLVRTRLIRLGKLLIMCLKKGVERTSIAFILYYTRWLPGWRSHSDTCTLSRERRQLEDGREKESFKRKSCSSYENRRQRDEHESLPVSPMM